MILSIYGPPGAGKTSVARSLLRDGVGYVSSGDIARKVDPEALAKGRMADRATLAVAFEEALGTAMQFHQLVIVDGLPRDPDDVRMLPPVTKFLFVTCTPSVSFQRQLERGRPGDDPDLIRIRVKEQFDLMGIGKARPGWATTKADVTLDTTYITKAHMLESARASAEAMFPEVFRF